MKMEYNKTRSKQKILVLIDFSKSSYMGLKYAISIAKFIEAKLFLLYIAKPGDLVKSDNPSVALRTIDFESRKAEVQLKSIAEMIEDVGVSAQYHNTVGDVPTKAHQYIELLRPDLIVIGKSKYGEDQLGELTRFLLCQFSENLLIVGNNLKFNEETNISVECNLDNLNDYNSNILYLLARKTKTPLRVYVSKRKRSSVEFNFPESWQNLADYPYKICTKNNQSFSIAKSILGHIKEEKIKLVCLGRKGKNKSIFTNLFNQTNTMVDIINNARIPTLILGKSE